MEKLYKTYLQLQKKLCTKIDVLRFTEVWEKEVT